MSLTVNPGFVDKAQGKELIALSESLNRYLILKKVKVNKGVNIRFTDGVDDDLFPEDLNYRFINVEAYYNGDKLLELEIKEKYQIFYNRILDILENIVSKLGNHSELEKLNQIRMELEGCNYQPEFLISKLRPNPSKTDRIALKIKYCFGYAKLYFFITDFKRKSPKKIEVFIMDVFPFHGGYSRIFHKGYWVNEEVCEIRDELSEIFFQVNVKTLQVETIFRPKENEIEALEGYLKAIEPFLDYEEWLKLVSR